MSRFRFVSEHRAGFGVKRLCRVLGVSRSGFYAWECRPPSAGAVRNAELGGLIVEVHQRSRRTYGAPRVHAELRRLDQGCSRKRVARLMRDAGLVGAHARRRWQRGRPDVARELARGRLSPRAVVTACPDDRSCVRVEHLSDRGQPAPEAGRRAPRGTGSKIQVRPGVWKFTATAGRYADGGVRRLHRTVQAHTEAEATRALAAFVAEVRRDRLPEHRRDREITVDEAIDQFLTEHLLNEKGREPRTVDDYWRLHRKWFARCHGLPARSVFSADSLSLFE